MRTYISAKYYYIISWICLMMFPLFEIVGLAIIAFGGLFPDGHLSLVFLVPIAAGFLFYPGMISRKIFVENGKVTVNGIFNTESFDPSDFEEVRKVWWSRNRNYTIHFKDGSSFYFVPRMYYGDTFSFKRFWNKTIMEEVQDIVDNAR
jgi:hypothetical protein